MTRSTAAHLPENLRLHTVGSSQKKGTIK
ncbi:hypothetical protein A2U01_0051329, partial [Trifolium medium]|nr:hypothetical protein [Trifolium medium]